MLLFIKYSEEISQINYCKKKLEKIEISFNTDCSERIWNLKKGKWSDCEVTYQLNEKEYKSIKQCLNKLKIKIKE